MSQNKYLFENDSSVCFYPVAHENSVIDNNNTTLYSKLSSIQSNSLDVSNCISKISYEYKTEINNSSESYKIQIGRFSCNNSNIIISIESTTDISNHGIAILTTQGWTDSDTGTYAFNVYEDDNNMISPYLCFKRYSNSDICDIYFNGTTYNKTLIHIRCINLNGNPTNICKSVSSIPSDANIYPNNILNGYINNQISNNIFKYSGGVFDTTKIQISSGKAYCHGARVAADKLAIGSNGILITAPETSGDFGGIYVYGSGQVNYFVITIGDDRDIPENLDHIVFRRYNGGTAVSNVYVPNKSGNLFLTSQIVSVSDYINSYDDPTKLETKSSSFEAYPNMTYVITSVTSNISITFGSMPSSYTTYEFRFLINYDDNNYSISLPSSITWQRSLTFTAGNLYELNILYNNYDNTLYGSYIKTPYVKNYIYLEDVTYTDWTYNSTSYGNLSSEASNYRFYESTNHSDGSTMALDLHIDVHGMPQDFTFYVRNYSESNCDFVTVNALDDQSSGWNSNTYYTNYGKSSDSTWYAVTFTNVSVGSHVIRVWYGHDGSGIYNADCGYVAVSREYD